MRTYRLLLPCPSVLQFQSYLPCCLTGYSFSRWNILSDAGINRYSSLSLPFSKLITSILVGCQKIVKWILVIYSASTGRSLSGSPSISSFSSCISCAFVSCAMARIIRFRSSGENIPTQADRSPILSLGLIAHIPQTNTVCP